MTCFKKARWVESDTIFPPFAGSQARKKYFAYNVLMTKGSLLFPRFSSVRGLSLSQKRRIYTTFLCLSPLWTFSGVCVVLCMQKRAWNDMTINKMRFTGVHKSFNYVRERRTCGKLCPWFHFTTAITINKELLAISLWMDIKPGMRWMKLDEYHSVDLCREISAV